MTHHISKSIVTIIGLLAAGSILSTTSAPAQDTTAADNGWRVQAGLSLISAKTTTTDDYYFWGSRSWNESYAGIAISADKKMFTCPGGSLLVGGEIDYLTGKLDLSNPPYTNIVDRTIIPVQATASWEYDKLLEGKLGIRAGTSLGLMYNSIKDKSPDGGGFNYSASNTPVIWGLHVGVNYNFAKRFYVDISERLLFIPGFTWISGTDVLGYPWHMSEGNKIAYQTNISIGWKF